MTNPLAESAISGRRTKALASFADWPKAKWRGRAGQAGRRVSERCLNLWDPSAGPAGPACSRVGARRGCHAARRVRRGYAVGTLPVPGAGLTSPRLAGLAARRLSLWPPRFCRPSSSRRWTRVARAAPGKSGLGPAWVCKFGGECVCPWTGLKSEKAPGNGVVGKRQALLQADVPSRTGCLPGSCQVPA